jgi:hypothetical protein
MLGILELLEGLRLEENSDSEVTTFHNEVFANPSLTF